MNNKQISKALFEIENEITSILCLGDIKMVRACLEVMEKQIQEIRYGMEKVNE